MGLPVKVDLGGHERRGHQLLAEPQLAHVRQRELLLGGVVRPVPHVVVDGRQLDRVRRFAQVIAALYVADGLDTEEVDVGLFCDEPLVLLGEQVLLEEEERKVRINKHNASRSGVEQPCDLTQEFKCTKDTLKYKEEHPEVFSEIVIVIARMLEALDTNATTGRVLKLELHKKKAILGSVCLLPASASKAYSPHNIRKGFLACGMIDKKSRQVPSYKGIINTCRGKVKGTKLENANLLFDTFYKE